MYSVVVPVYNSEKSLSELYDRVSKVFQELSEQFELILVDDGSKDQSYRIMTELREKDPRVKCIQLATNHGQQRAVMCGFEFANGDYVITMDDDLQHPPEEIPTLIRALEERPELDVIIGTYDEKQHGPIRKLGSSMMNTMSNMIYKKNKDIRLTSFRLMKKYVVENLKSVSVSLPTIGPLLLQTNQRIGNVVVHHDERAYGKSGYSFRKLVAAFVGNLINNSDLLVKSISACGILSVLGGFVWLIVNLIRHYGAGAPIAGWQHVVTAMLMIGGVVLISVGIIGKYVSNLMIEAKKMPKYLIRDKKI